MQTWPIVVFKSKFSVCTHTCVYSPMCCVHSHVCSGHVLYLLAVFARAWRAQRYRGSGRQRGLGQSVGEGPEWGSPLKWGEGTGQRLGLAGVRRRVRSPWRLAWPGVSLEAAAGIGQGLVIKGSTWPAPSAMMPAVEGGAVLAPGVQKNVWQRGRWCPPLPRCCPWHLVFLGVELGVRNRTLGPRSRTTPRLPRHREMRAVVSCMA